MAISATTRIELASFRWTRCEALIGCFELLLGRGPIGLEQNQDIEQHPHPQTHKQIQKMLLEKKRKNKRAFDCPLPQAA